MARGLLAAMLVLSAASVSGVSTASASESVPVLGAKGAFPNGRGFGQAKPRLVYLGGDPTGYVSAIAWRHWGARRAVGFGQGWCPGQTVAAGHHCLAALHVSSLGTCRGRRAYRTLVFYFKDHGKWMFGSRWNACSGS